MRKIFWLSFLLLFVPVLSLNAQLTSSSPNLISADFDRVLLERKAISNNKQIMNKKTTFMKSRTKNVFVKYNPIRLFFGSLMFVYQGYISPQLPSDCLYAETCSHYSQSLIIRFGLLKGVVATSDRLMRCNRLSTLDIIPYSLDILTGKVVESVEIYDFSDN